MAIFSPNSKFAKGCFLTFMEERLVSLLAFLLREASSIGGWAKDEGRLSSRSLWTLEEKKKRYACLLKRKILHMWTQTAAFLRILSFSFTAHLITHVSGHEQETLSHSERTRRGAVSTWLESRQAWSANLVTKRFKTTKSAPTRIEFVRVCCMKIHRFCHTKYLCVLC